MSCYENTALVEVELTAIAVEAITERKRPTLQSNSLQKFNTSCKQVSSKISDLLCQLFCFSEQRIKTWRLGF